MICRVPGCSNEREKKGYSVSCKQKYRPICSHHAYLKEKGLPVDYKTKPSSNVFRGSFIRDVCVINGCRRKQVSKGLRCGRQRYDVYCTAHRQLEKQGLPLDIDLEQCSVCGWAGPCDKHRLKAAKDGGGYSIENVIIVCPNCHRDYHRGINPYQRLRRKKGLSA